MREKNLLIRVDANTRMGTGHVMRCLALAQAWQDAGGITHFVCAEIPDRLAARLVAEGMVLHHLNETPGSRADSEQTTALARQIGADWVVEDGYHFDADYQRAIKEAGLRLLVIDDYGQAGHYSADVVLNQNIYADESIYISREPTTQLLLGTNYVLLRREFWFWRNWHRMIPDMARNILITMGGSDPDNQTLRVAKAIQQIKDIDLSVIVVVGSGNPHLRTLRESIVNSQYIRLIHDATNMSELMAWADIAISSGGSTCWELCFLGTPSLLISIAENQRKIAQGLASVGAAIDLGWHEKLETHAIANSLTKAIYSTEIRKKLSENGQKLVNNAGISLVLRYLQGKNLILRRANKNDCHIIWLWSNDPVIRQNSFHSDPIPWESHFFWYNSKISEPNVLFFIASNTLGEPIGYIRFEPVNTAQFVVSVAISPDQRGIGYGKHLIMLGMQEVQRMVSVDTFHAYIKTSNQASIRAFSGVGYSEAEVITINGCQAFHYVWRRQGDIV